jgi:hypothetical protein
MRETVSAIVLCAGAVAVAACAAPDPREREVTRGVEFARATLERTRTDRFAALALRSVADQGGTLSTYVLAHAPGPPDGAGGPDAGAGRGPKMAPFQQDGPARPWSVRLRQERDTGTVVIEGFGADVGRPLRVERVRLDLAASGAPRP